MSVTSAPNAWAVGYAGTRSLIEHWNGRAWQIQPSPNPGASGEAALVGVAATSPRNAWAVGYYGNRAGRRSHVLIEHWNGKAWNVQSITRPRVLKREFIRLVGVAATSARSAWAVGWETFPKQRPVIEHWNGKVWQFQAGRKNPYYDQPLAVTATSPHNAWAVGKTAAQSLIERWDGQTWQGQTSPNPYNVALTGAAATSSTNAWAVGYSAAPVGDTGESSQTVIEHWNGSAWQDQASPNPSAFDIGDNIEQLSSVTATSSSNAWAVGYLLRGPVIDHWNGNAWTSLRRPGGSDASTRLFGVAASSPSNVWAVGSQDGNTVALHCV